MIILLDEKKVTVEQFYRVSGKSHQSQGIVPDLILPSIYDGFEISEKHQNYAITNDSTPVTLKPIKLKPLPIKSLKQNSQERLTKHKGFESIKLMNESLLKNYIKKKTQYPLTLKNIYTDTEHYSSIWKTYNAYQDELELGLTIRNSKKNAEILEYNPEDKEDNAKQMKDLAKDLYIQEANLILTDLLNLKSKQ